MYTDVKRKRSALLVFVTLGSAIVFAASTAQAQETGWWQRMNPFRWFQKDETERIIPVFGR